MAYQCIELGNIPCCVKSQSGFSTGSIWYSDLSVNNNIYNSIPTTSGFQKIYECGDIGIYLNKYDRGNNYWDISIYGRDETNNIDFNYLSFAVSKNAYASLGIFVVIDDDTQLGEITFGWAYNNYGDPQRYDITGFNPNNAKYQSIKNAIIPPYTWTSVPSISGKNGILQPLVQIKEEALNDGEPVSEATVLSFDSLGNVNIPNIIDEQMPVDPSDVTSVTATYLIPALENGTYEGIKLLVKKGSIPTSEEDADKVVNLDEPTSILRIDSKSVGNLDEDSHYYFVVKLVDEVGTEATSDPKDIWTSHSEGWSFDYTGEIQTFVAPKTGIYQLETWGAQGGDATDGTLTARGGYGAYAVGEVFLTQGDTLYINVGGQNGYGGGGGFASPIELLLQTTDSSHMKDYQGANHWIDDIPSDIRGTDWWCYVGQQNGNPAYFDDETKSICTDYNPNIGTYIGSANAIPTNHLYINSLSFKVSAHPLNSQGCGIQLYKLVNGNFEMVQSVWTTTSEVVEQNVTVTVNDYVDYLFIYNGMLSQNKGFVITDVDWN